jgi:acyl-CoA thioesterase
MTSKPVGRADAYPHAADLALIPFAMGSDRRAAHFVLTPDLTRHDGALYGGTGAAAAVMLMEATTQRTAIWVSTQFVAQARIGERIDLVAHTLAQGKRIAQVHVVAQVDDRIIFTALGATAHPRPHGLTGQYDDMPRCRDPKTVCRSITGRPCRNWRSAASTATSSSARRPLQHRTHARWLCGHGSRVRDAR